MVLKSNNILSIVGKGSRSDLSDNTFYSVMTTFYLAFWNNRALQNDDSTRLYANAALFTLYSLLCTV